MKRSVFIIRHAKSDQNFFSNDFDRPLNERGVHDAPIMAKRLKKAEPDIHAFVASPASRTKTTATFFAAEYSIPQDDIIFVTSLYHGNAAAIYNVISNLPDDLINIALIAHNPGVTEFVNELFENVHIDNMPTCGIFAFSVKGAGTWKAFAKAKKEFLFFDYPKSVAK